MSLPCYHILVKMLLEICIICLRLDYLVLWWIQSADLLSFWIKCYNSPCYGWSLSAHLLRQYERSDERKRILGRSTGSHAAQPLVMSVDWPVGLSVAPYVTPVEMGLMKASLLFMLGAPSLPCLHWLRFQAPVVTIAMTVFWLICVSFVEFACVNLFPVILVWLYQYV